MHALTAARTFLAAHAILIGWCLGAYALLAALINQWIWPKPQVPPAAKWQVHAHLVLVDWPAALPSRGATGRGVTINVFGLPIAVPLLSWSDVAAGLPMDESITKRQTIVPPTPPPTPPPARGDKGALPSIAIAAILAMLALIMGVVMLSQCIGCSSYMLPTNPTPAMVTQIECQSLNSKVVGYTAAGFVTGALSGGSGLTALLVQENVPRYITGGASLVLSGLGALWSYLATDAARQYAQTCTANVGGVANSTAPMMVPAPSPLPVMLSKP